MTLADALNSGWKLWKTWGKWRTKKSVNGRSVVFAEPSEKKLLAALEQFEQSKGKGSWEPERQPAQSV